MVVAIFLLSSAFLAYDSLSTYVNPYLSVTQVARFPERYANKNVQVIGVVDMNSVVMEAAGDVKFDITDGGDRLPIVYRGSLPQNSDQSENVVVIGTVTDTGSLESTQILIKCPSKYESKEEAPLSNQFFVAALLLIFAAVAYLVVTMLWKKG